MTVFRSMDHGFSPRRSSFPLCPSHRRRLRRHTPGDVLFYYFLAIILLAWPATASLINPADQHTVASLRPDMVDFSSIHPHRHDGFLSHTHVEVSKRSSPDPKPFDTSLSNNFTTASCPEFFSAFLSNQTVASCNAISLLLRDSSSFFHILSSVPETSHVLDTACAAPFAECASIFSSLAHTIRSESACKQDLELGNPLAHDALTDFLAYEPVYRSTCLTDPASGNYCFLDAVTSNNAADYSVYFIPLGVQLTPNSGNLTCEPCLQATMKLFATLAAVRGQPLAQSYLPSATVVNGICGNGFADTNVAVQSIKTLPNSDPGSLATAASFLGFGAAGLACLTAVAVSGWVLLA